MSTMRVTAARLGGAALAVVVLGAIAARAVSAHGTPPGLRVSGTLVAEGSSAHAVVSSLAAAALARPIGLTLDGERVLVATLAELGVTADVEGATRLAASLGQEGGWAERLAIRRRARAGLLDVPIRYRAALDPLAARLEAVKEGWDRRPVSARLERTTGRATPHEDGRFLDLYALAAALARAAVSGERLVELPALRVAPRATAEVVARIDRDAALAVFETRYAHRGAQASRAANIARAAERLDGLVLLPGELLSFNAAVGPRTLENGFEPGWEIYRGEMREGIGGGTCQVASTLHAAALLAGLEIVERSPHSRPSAYIPMGLDATVVFPDVDLKIKNAHPFPVVLFTAAGRGVTAVEVRGRHRVAEVSFRREIVGMRPYARRVEEAAWLPPGEVLLKQHGVRGFTVTRQRTLRFPWGEERVERSVDVYPPTLEIFVVPEGADAAAILPPLPDEGDPDDGEPDAAPSPAASGVTIKVAPSAQRPARQPARLSIRR